MPETTGTHGGIRVHNFRESHDQSERDAGWFLPFYRKIWPDAKHYHRVKNVQWQKKGIDTRIDFEGFWVGVEEKLRSKYRPDVALEVWSNFEGKVKGWAVKDQVSTWLAYGWQDVNRLLLLEYPTLQAVLSENRPEWQTHAENKEAGFFLAKAQNPGYTTISICVPLAIICKYVPHTWWGNYDFWSPYEA